MTHKTDINLGKPISSSVNLVDGLTDAASMSFNMTMIVLLANIWFYLERRHFQAFFC